MAEIATIARPYAEALFKSQMTQANPAQAEQWLSEMACVAHDERLLAWAGNPGVVSAEVFELIKGLIKATLTDEALNFLRIIIDQDRLSALPEIHHQFKVLVNEKNGQQDAVVQSPFDLDEQTLSGLSGLLEKKFARKLNLTVELKPELIGGIRVVVGDEVLDTSVKARLEQMKVALTH